VNSRILKKGGGKGKAMRVTGIVIPQTFDNNLSLSGSIEANEQVEIRSEVSGIVESINFTEGSNVTKGQLLFKVNDIELRAQLGQARTKKISPPKTSAAPISYSRKKPSARRSTIFHADFQSAKAQTQLISAQIAKTSVRAPFGKIGLRSISAGTYITPTVLVARLVNTGKLKITFSIPEKYATQVKTNSNLSFTVSGSETKYQAKVYAVEPGVDVATRTLQIRAIADNKEGKLLPAPLPT
jgi:membrane fusion protein (multidrug efflux system)